MGKRARSTDHGGPLSLWLDAPSLAQRVRKFECDRLVRLGFARAAELRVGRLDLPALFDRLETWTPRQTDGRRVAHRALHTLANLEQTERALRFGDALAAALAALRAGLLAGEDAAPGLQALRRKGAKTTAALRRKEARARDLKLLQAYDKLEGDPPERVRILAEQKRNTPTTIRRRLKKARTTR